MNLRLATLFLLSLALLLTSCTTDPHVKRMFDATRQVSGSIIRVTLTAPEPIGTQHHSAVVLPAMSEGEVWAVCSIFWDTDCKPTADLAVILNEASAYGTYSVGEKYRAQEVRFDKNSRICIFVFAANPAPAAVSVMAQQFPAVGNEVFVTGWMSETATGMDAGKVTSVIADNAPGGVRRFQTDMTGGSTYGGAYVNTDGHLLGVGLFYGCETPDVDQALYAPDLLKIAQSETLERIVLGDGP